MLFDRIKQLARNRGVSLKKVATDLGFGENTIYKWKTQSPKAEYLEKVADYFDVTVDYLLGRNDEADMVHNMTVDEALGTVMSFDGKPVTDHDKKVMKDLLESYLRNRD